MQSCIDAHDGDNEGRDQNELINLARDNDVRVYGTSGFCAEESHPSRRECSVLQAGEKRGRQVALTRVG